MNINLDLSDPDLRFKNLYPKTAIDGFPKSFIGVCLQNTEP